MGQTRRPRTAMTASSMSCLLLADAGAARSVARRLAAASRGRSTMRALWHFPPLPCRESCRRDCSAAMRLSAASCKYSLQMRRWHMFARRSAAANDAAV
jgi:hypothetical protein